MATGKFSDEAKRLILEGHAVDSEFNPFERVGDEVRLKTDEVQIHREAAGLRISYLWRGKEIMWERFDNLQIGQVLTLPINRAITLTDE